MPLYEYICNNQECDKATFEVITSYEEKPERCPSCKVNSDDRKKFYQFTFTGLD